MDRQRMRLQTQARLDVIELEGPPQNHSILVFLCFRFDWRKQLSRALRSWRGH